MRYPLLLALVVVCTFTHELYSQIPTGRTLWYSADDTILTPGAAVGSWRERDGKSPAVQSEETRQPLLVQEASGIRYLQLLWNQFFVAPSVFPTRGDYTIVVVARIRDTGSINNLVSGERRAYWFENSRYPAAAHENRFQEKAFSTLPIQEGFNIMMLQHRDKTGQAIHFINGRFGDSLWVGQNADSTLLIGSYNKQYFSNIDLAEVVVYSRVLSDIDRSSLEDHLFVKYKITRPAPLPPPDRTFTSRPMRLQLYPRGPDDSATVPITGAIRVAGFDSVYAEFAKNGTLLERRVLPLSYVDGDAPFDFRFRIRAELSEHRFPVGLIGRGRDSILHFADSVVSGDVILIGGISNATFGAWGWKNTYEYARTFGMNLSYNPRDTQWTISDVNPWGLGASVSGWGATLQQLIAERHGIPTCIINWGAAGTIIDHHLKKETHMYDLSTYYGRMLYRLDKSGLRNAIKAMYFWGGELDQFIGYEEKFRTLYAQLREDLPSLQKTYMLQMRPSYCANLYSEHMRDLQRRLQDSLPDLETISPTPWIHYDGCHFDDEGQKLVGEKLYLPFARDFYGLEDTIGLRSPTIRQAYYTDSNYGQLALEFSPPSTQVTIGQDTSILGMHAALVDYIYLDSLTGKIQAATTVGNRVILKLKEPYLASKISYVPDRHYHGTEIIYQGPWIYSQKGFGALTFHNVPVSLTRGVTEDGGDSRVFPNPASDQITFTHDKGGTIEVRIFDIHGRSVIDEKYTFSQTATSSKLDVRKLPNGTYFLRLVRPETVEVHRVVILR